MQTERITLSSDVARVELAKYRAARAPATDEDRAIMRVYREVARGRVVVQAHASIRAAGADELGRPRLAIVRADARKCGCFIAPNRVEFYTVGSSYRQRRQRVNWPDHDMSPYQHYRAIVPLVPLHLRPKAASLRDYWILWEADWEKAPVDPMLLRQLSGDLWLVVAAWDLTDVERAALSNR